MKNSNLNPYMLAQLKRHEGLRLNAYLDTEGVLTIGYGHNCKVFPVEGVSAPGDAITSEQAARLFMSDIMAHVFEADDNFEWLSFLSSPRKAVVYNMVFNLGLARFLGFKKAIAAMQGGFWADAARHMLDSRWAVQVGQRAIELAEQMDSGRWPEHLLKERG